MHVEQSKQLNQVTQRVGLERTHLYRKLKQLGIQVGKRQTDKNS